MYILAEPLGYLIRPIYELCKNYGVTLIIVTILIRLATIPLTVMSQKSAARTQLIQPELNKLQQKYKNDKEKLGIEMQKLYSKYNVNPLGGCLPLIVQMFILFGFIDVVYKPLKYILQLSEKQISGIMKAVGARVGTYQVELCGMESVKEMITKMGLKPINFDFLGIDLTKVLKGNESDYLLWIFPLLAVSATFLSSYIAKKQMSQSTKGNEATEQAASMSNTMMMIMPFMTAYFTYIMPAGMSLYWFISTISQLIQQTVITAVVKKKIENEVVVSEVSVKKKGKKKK